MSLPEIPPVAPIVADVYEYDMAVILDGVVHQVINTTPQTAAIYNAQPTFVQVDRNVVREGFLYDADTQTFSAPE
jgi:hypothetical protein